MTGHNFSDYKIIIDYICRTENCDLADLVISMSTIRMLGLEDLMRPNNKKRKFSIKSLEKSNLVSHTISTQIFINEKRNISYSDATGLFKVIFNDETWIYFWKYLEMDKQEINTIGIAFPVGWVNMETLIRQQNINYQMPRKGLHHAYMRNLSYGKELTYYELEKKKFPKYEVFHPVFDEVLNDVIVFFESDGNIYKRFNKPRIRKILLTGEPGTGKTSINLSLGKKLGTTHSVIFANDMQSIIRHLQNIEIYEMPTIVIFEDCENELKDVSSFVLNFLDGLNQPNIKKGAYVIFTTNHPEIIEDRIIKRPGRIDKIFNIGPLTGRFAFECARYYFEGLFEIEESHAGIFSNLTGAQISEISKASIIKAIEKNKEIDLDIIRQVKEELLTQLREVEKMAERNSYKGRRRLGFNEDSPF